MTIALTQPYEDLRFMTPLSEQREETLVRFLARDLRGLVLDIGCGWGELLLRVITAVPDAVGFGIDLDGEAIEHARQLAAQHGLNQRVTFVCGDARTESPKKTDALICIGASQIWGPRVEDNQPLDCASALVALRAKVSQGAHVVYGEGIWSQPPTAAAVEPLSGRLDELVSLPELVDIAVAHGFMPVSVHEASIDEWDEFESGFSARYADGSPITVRTTLTPPKSAVEPHASEPVTCAATAGHWAWRISPCSPCRKTSRSRDRFERVTEWAGVHRRDQPRTRSRGCQQGDNKSYRNRPKRCGLQVGQKAAICGRFTSYAETRRNRGPALLIHRSQVRSLPGPLQTRLQISTVEATFPRPGEGSLAHCEDPGIASARRDDASQGASYPRPSGGRARTSS
jgi:SAM-dependent methyltransferase